LTKHQGAPGWIVEAMRLADELSRCAVIYARRMDMDACEAKNEARAALLAHLVDAPAPVIAGRSPSSPMAG
jgi:hypothetical protein